MTNCFYCKLEPDDFATDSRVTSGGPQCSIRASIFFSLSIKSKQP